MTSNKGRRTQTLGLDSSNGVRRLGEKREGSPPVVLYVQILKKLGFL